MQLTSHSRNVVLLQTPLAVAATLLGFVLAGCGTTMHLPSHWPEKQIVVDGKNSEWDRTYLIDDNKLVIGFVNDSNFVYLLLATNDRPLARSMMRGLTVWFDAHGGNDKTFGIHYPMGGMFSRDTRSSGVGNDESLLEPAERFDLIPSELEILGPGKNDRHRMQIMETGGIQAKYDVKVNSFVYELRVPFTQGDRYPFTIRSKVGNVIGLGLETSQEKPQRKEQSTSEGGREGEAGDSGDEGGFGRGGARGGGRGTERGGRGQAGVRESTGPLDIWMQVKLVPNEETQNSTTKVN